jgi:ElaB/YqjD/DUF883 family membrane-anchored ribosome-binding protein
MDSGVELSEMSSLKSKARSWEKEIRMLVGDHPRIALAAAATAGVLLGWMVKRK